VSNEDKSGSADQRPDTPQAPQLERRLFIFRATAILGGALGIGGARSAHGQQKDFDVTDRGGQGPQKKGAAPKQTGISDSDPDDPKGAGVGGGPRFGPTSGGQGATDSDPSDPKGGGKGGPRQATGITDKDPSDAAGAGRGKGAQQVAGVTDKDPGDPAGGGRKR